MFDVRGKMEMSLRKPWDDGKSYQFGRRIKVGTITMWNFIPEGKILQFFFYY